MGGAPRRGGVGQDQGRGAVHKLPSAGPAHGECEQPALFGADGGDASRAAAAHERRQFEAYDPRRWGGVAPWTAEEAGDISADYFEYKRRMERAGASAEETPVPANLRRFAYTSLPELREIEENGAVPRQQTPRRGEDWPETDYPFLRRLPPGIAGARITLRHSREQRRIVGWCAHPCTVPHHDAICGGAGRCLRPVALGAQGSHGASGSHKCPQC